MSDRARRFLSVLAICAVALVVWLPTIGWGLPSRDADPYLFGDRRPWTGAEIVALTATTHPADEMRGADVDADPIVDRSKPVILNDTDAKRAAIVRRYRLMSGQPDEFIQFKALGEMAGRSGLAKLDPRLYQYGGLWMYPVGALVRTAMLVGYIPSPPPGTPAIEFYLDHPEAFGRFYVVARFYSWCWGVVAAFAIAWIARRVTESIGLATLAAVAFMLLPVTRTATHEAKPHLAGAALCLCAVIAATRYVETGRRRWLIGAGALCGAAMAMVVSMLVSCAVLPTMVWLRSRAMKRSDTPTPAGSDPETLDARSHPTPQGSAWSDRFRSIVASLMTSLAVAAIVYLATNPFVLINAIAHPEVLRSNLGNSTAMYNVNRVQAIIDGTTRSIRAAISMKGVVLFAIGIALIANARVRFSSLRSTTVGLAFSIAFVNGIQVVLLAGAKPAEYARFAIVPVAVACAVWPLALIQSKRIERIVLCVALWILFGLPQFVTFVPTRRLATREVDAALHETNASKVVRVNWEPAPWSLPPLDLFRSRIELGTLRPSTPADGMVAIYPLNLASQVGEQTFLEVADWRENIFAMFPLVAGSGGRARGDWHVNSSSRPAGSRPAG